MKRFCCGFSVLIVTLLTSTCVVAQDTHYWNNQYGPRAMLLGGIIIGSVSDMSATYYNPGALGYIAEPELILSANVYQNSALTVKDGAGKNIEGESDMDTIHHAKQNIKTDSDMDTSMAAGMNWSSEAKMNWSGNADMNVTLEAKMNNTVKAALAMTMEGGPSVTIKAAMVMIN